MMTRTIREFIDMIRAEGFAVTEIFHGRHVRARVTYRGQHRVLTVPVSPSDHRATMNYKSQLRKLKRELEQA
jgi:alpha-D-ribose 1-methylphosphonate 5-triphosphate synthase subunit PhnL